MAKELIAAARKQLAALAAERKKHAEIADRCVRDLTAIEKASGKGAPALSGPVGAAFKKAADAQVAALKAEQDEHDKLAAQAEAGITDLTAMLRGLGALGDDDVDALPYAALKPTPALKKFFEEHRGERFSAREVITQLAAAGVRSPNPVRLRRAVMSGLSRLREDNVLMCEKAEKPEGSKRRGPNKAYIYWMEVARK